MVGDLFDQVSLERALYGRLEKRLGKKKEIWEEFRLYDKSEEKSYPSGIKIIRGYRYNVHGFIYIYNLTIDNIYPVTEKDTIKLLCAPYGLHRPKICNTSKSFEFSKPILESKYTTVIASGTGKYILPIFRCFSLHIKVVCYTTSYNFLMMFTYPSIS